MAASFWRSCPLSTMGNCAKKARRRLQKFAHLLVPLWTVGRPFTLMGPAHMRSWHANSVGTIGLSATKGGVGPPRGGCKGPHQQNRWYVGPCSGVYQCSWGSPKVPLATSRQPPRHHHQPPKGLHPPLRIAPRSAKAVIELHEDVLKDFDELIDSFVHRFLRHWQSGPPTTCNGTYANLVAAQYGGLLIRIVVRPH